MRCKIINDKIIVFLIISILCVTSTVKAEISYAPEDEIKTPVETEEIFGIACVDTTVIIDGVTQCVHCCAFLIFMSCDVIYNASCNPAEPYEAQSPFDRNNGALFIETERN